MSKKRSILFSQLFAWCLRALLSSFQPNSNPNGNDLAKDFSNPKGLIIIHSNKKRTANFLFLLLHLSTKQRYMAFSKLTGVGSECGPDNGLNSLVKHFGQDGSLQQVGCYLFA